MLLFDPGQQSSQSQSAAAERGILTDRIGFFKFRSSCGESVSAVLCSCWDLKPGDDR
jgi:hypothetical protein